MDKRIKKAIAGAIFSAVFAASFSAPIEAMAARLFSAGHELNSPTAGMEFEIASTTAAQISSTTKRSGSYALCQNSAASTRQGFGHVHHSVSNVGPFYYRFYLYIDTLPGGITTIWSNSAGTGITGGSVVAIRMNTDGTLELWEDAAAQVGSDSAALSVGQWYRIDIKADRSGGAGASEARALLNGVEFAGSNTLTLGANFTSFRWGTNHLAEAQTNAVLCFDDIAMNDSSGGSQNSYPGDGAIVLGRPDSDGANTGWTNTYTQVDDSPTPDDASTFVLDSVLDEIDDYNFNVPAAIDSYDNISLIQVGMRMNRAGGAGTDTTIVPRHLTASGGTLTEGTAQVVNTTTWRTNAIATPRNYGLSIYSPGTGADIDDDQIGVRVSSAGSAGREAQVTAMWALIEYTDGSPPASGATYEDIIWFY